MNIGFDIDGVLYPWHEYIYNELVKTNKTDLTYHYFWSSGIWTQDYYQELLAEYAKDASLVTKTSKRNEKLEHAVIMLSKVANLYFITQRPQECAIATFDWIRETFLGADIDYKRIFITKDKVELLTVLHRYTGLDYYIEDRPNLAKAIQDIGINTLLITQPYNHLETYSGSRFDTTLDAINYILYNRTFRDLYG